MSRNKVYGDSLTGHGFAQSRKNKCFKKYMRAMKRDSMKERYNRRFSNEQKTKHKKVNDLMSTRKAYQLEKKAKEQRLKEMQEERQRKQETVKKNIEKRKKISKALRKRTKKGQPIMKSQIDYMLDKLGCGAHSFK